MEMTREEKKIVRARVAMMLDTPFFGHIAMQLEPIARKDLNPPTMGTDGFRLFFHPEWVKELPEEQLKGVIAHEVAHVVLLHLTRRQSREPIRWNVACVTGDTLVTMADGSLKPIKDIQSGEEIVGYKNGKPTIGTVLLQFSKESDKMVEVSNDSYQLTCTEDHHILTEEGYVKAGKLGTSRVTVEPRGLQLRNQQLSSYDYCRDSQKAQTLLWNRRDSSRTERYFRDKEADSLPKVSDARENDRATMGLFRRDSGWRRNNHDQNFQGQGSPLSFSKLTSLKYELRTCQSSYQMGLLRSESEERERAPILETNARGMASCKNPRTSESLSDYQTKTYEAGSGAHSLKVKSRVQIRANREDVGDTARNPGFEQTGVKVRRRRGKVQVYDLITTCHSYIANGIVVHNCDFAVNHLVLQLQGHDERGREIRFELPPNVLHNPNFADKEAEWIYNQLPETEVIEVTLTLDSHDDWMGGNGGGKGKKDEGEGKSEVSQGGAGENGDEEDKAPADTTEGLEQRIREMVAQSANQARMKGKLPGYLKELVEGVLQPKLDWKTILQDMIVSCVKSDFCMMPPNKKHLYRGFILPGLTGTEINVACIIDTSGSISSKEMQEFLAEVKGICDAYEEYTIYLMTCDTEVHQRWEIRPFDPMPTVMEGRGGTDFREALAEAERLPVTSIIYLTDGFGSYPDKEPMVPVIWVSSTDYKYPWGQVIRLPERK